MGSRLYTNSLYVPKIKVKNSAAVSPALGPDGSYISVASESIISIHFLVLRLSKIDFSL